MNNATKQQLKKPDQFVSLTEHGIAWAGKNRQTAALAAALVLLAILGSVGGYVEFEHRSSAAATAFGAAMQVYQTPLAASGQPLPPGMKSYATATERAAAANAQFSAIAHQYGLTSSGRMALYFAGLTFTEEGQNGSAEATLKKVAGSWDRDLAASAKLALAQLYQQTGRDALAVDVYNQLANGHATTVPPYLAQLQLAEMYTTEGKNDMAKAIYAKIKDQDKDAKGDPGPAATVAKEKLDPKPTGPQQ